MAANHFIKNGNNRVILATDGDFNVGLKKEEDLEEMILQQRQSGIYLTCLGVGMGNYKDSKIQSLARKGNGNFAYLDNYREAEKVLLQEFTQTLYAVADDVFMTVEFNPEHVKSYRLIGFDNKVGALKDSLSAIEGGEAGSGQSMMAVFEVMPVDSNTNVSSTGPLQPRDYAAIRLQYKLPGKNSVKSFNYNCPYQFLPFTAIPQSYRFSTAVVMFGILLKQSVTAKNINWSDIITIATQSMQPGNLPQQELVSIVQQAKTLYSKQKRKRKSQSTGE
jgi:Ca-activated chloride channel family protein